MHDDDRAGLHLVHHRANDHGGIGLGSVARDDLPAERLLAGGRHETEVVAGVAAAGEPEEAGALPRHLLDDVA